MTTPSKVLFLDIDGVLNTERFLSEVHRKHKRIGRMDYWAMLEPARVTRLNAILDATGASVVLSSSWRQVRGLPDINEDFIQRGFTHQLFDKTPRCFGVDRHWEIRRWLNERHIQPDAFVVLDDDLGAEGPFKHRFIHVPDGLEDKHVEQAIAVLGRRVEVAP